MMNIAINKLSALKLMRSVREAREDRAWNLVRRDLVAPSPYLATRWSPSVIDLSRFGKAGEFSDDAPLSVAVPSARNRLRMKSAANTVYGEGLPAGSFLDLGGGVFISSPELLFVEAASIMSTAAHVLLGYELCGEYARDALSPVGGKAAMNIPPVTTVQKISAFLDKCKGIHGLTAAKRNLRYVADNAWSPFESIVSTLLVLPIWELGYGFRGVILNKRQTVVGGRSVGEVGSRVPDILIAGTKVGINYDGSGHLDLDSIAWAAVTARENPQDEEAQENLRKAIARVRAKVVDDKRRDRELGSSGLLVMPVTKEDLYEPGRFEALVHLILDGMERDALLESREQRSLLMNRALARKRQEMVWSLLPGERGHTLACKLAREEEARMRGTVPVQVLPPTIVYILQGEKNIDVRNAS